MCVSKMFVVCFAFVCVLDLCVVSKLVLHVFIKEFVFQKCVVRFRFVCVFFQNWCCVCHLWAIVDNRIMNVDNIEDNIVTIC